MDVSTWLVVIVAIAQFFAGVVMFLVGRLLSSNKQAIDDLRLAMRDVATVIDSLRVKLTSLEVAVARLEERDRG